MSAWEYKVVYVDFRGRVSIEGEELYLEKGQRRSEFALDRFAQHRDRHDLGGLPR